MHDEVYNEAIRIIGSDALPEKGLIVLDIGAFFPYVNQNACEIEAFLADSIKDIDTDKKFEDIVLNRRYTNKGYITISQKKGRKVSKCGYFINRPVDELNGTKYLIVKYSIGQGDKISIVVPINIKLTEDRPASYLTVHLLLEEPNKPKLQILVDYPLKDSTGWHCNRFYSKKIENWNNDTDHLLKPDTKRSDKEKHIIVFDTTQPVPMPKAGYDQILIY